MAELRDLTEECECGRELANASEKIGQSKRELAHHLEVSKIVFRP